MKRIVFLWSWWFWFFLFLFQINFVWGCFMSIVFDIEFDLVKEILIFEISFYFQSSGAELFFLFLWSWNGIFFPLKNYDKIVSLKWTLLHPKHWSGKNCLILLSNVYILIYFFFWLFLLVCMRWGKSNTWSKICAKRFDLVLVCSLSAINDFFFFWLELNR